MAVAPAAADFIHAIAERKECIGTHSCALQRSLRFDARDFHGVDAAHLSRSNGRGDIACENTIALDFTNCATTQANSIAFHS